MSRKRYRSLSAFKKDRRLTLQEIADLVGGITPSAVSLYVRGKRCPQPAIALRIASKCGVSLDALLRRAA